jgi:hypothetical protein
LRGRGEGLEGGLLTSSSQLVEEGINLKGLNLSVFSPSLAIIRPITLLNTYIWEVGFPIIQQLRLIPKKKKRKKKKKIIERL